MSTCSAHVLDAARGRPAAGMAVTLRDAADPMDVLRAEAETDSDGRIRFDAQLRGGRHVLTFGTGAWFSATDRASFYPEVVISVDIDPSQAHYHVALLLSPFSYTTYRGS